MLGAGVIIGDPNTCRLRVALLGGEWKFVGRQSWPAGACIWWFGDEMSAVNNLGRAIRAGARFDHIIANRWIAHSMLAKLRSAGVFVEVWPSGLAALAQELARRVP